MTRRTNNNFVADMSGDEIQLLPDQTFPNISELMGTIPKDLGLSPKRKKVRNNNIFYLFVAWVLLSLGIGSCGYYIGFHHNVSQVSKQRTKLVKPGNSLHVETTVVDESVEKPRVIINMLPIIFGITGAQTKIQSESALVEKPRPKLFYVDGQCFTDEQVRNRDPEYLNFIKKLRARIERYNQRHFALMERGAT